MFYAVICGLIALFALNKTIGYWSAFFACFFLTPAIGFWIIIFSKSKSKEFQEHYKIRLQQAQLKSINELKQGIDKSNISVIDKLKELEKLKQNQTISNDEFEAMKRNILND